MAWWQRTHLPMRRPGFDLWVRKIPWRKKWQPTPVFLPRESHGQKSLALERGQLESPCITAAEPTPPQAPSPSSLCSATKEVPECHSEDPVLPKRKYSPPNQSLGMRPRHLLFDESFLGDSDAAYVLEKSRFRG